MKRTALLALAAVCAITVWAGTSVTLEWDPSPSPSVGKYRLYWGPKTLRYTNFVNTPGTNYTVTVSNLVRGVYFFAATAVDTNGLESEYSNEVSWTNTTTSPLRFKIHPQP